MSIVDNRLFEVEVPYKYLIDTSSILSQRDNEEKHWREVNETLWEFIEEKVRSHIIVTCSEVVDELKGKDDEISSWLKSSGMVSLKCSNTTQLHLARVVNGYPGIVNMKKLRNSADPHIVAHALEFGLTVITEERKTSHLPIACSIVGVNCINMNELRAIEKWIY